MKKALSLLSLAVLTIGLLGSCSKINERIDGVEKRVESIENEKIASIENQIAAINSSIADLGQIRSDISSLKQSAVNHGQDISELQEADETLKNRIDNLEDYLDGTLTKFAEKDWAIATFATLEQLNATKTSLSTLEGKVNKLGETFDGKLSDLKTELTNSINDAIAGVNASISTLEARVSALEAMIQSVSITPAYSDGSVEAVDSILTLKCIVSPAEALLGMESLKDSLLIYADSVKVKTKADTSAYMEIKVSEAAVTDAAQGAITLKANISEYLPKGEDKALTVAVNIKNGISDFTTEFVPVYAKAFKAVYNTNGGANTLTFYFDAKDHSGEGIVYEGTGLFNTEETTAQKKWGYNDKRGEIKRVVIDASVAGYIGLTSTASMFQGMDKATNISGAEYLDVSNVTDMSWMFQNFGGGASGSPTTLNSVPDVSGWDTGKVTNMTAMFESYGNFSDNLAIVPDVSNWNTGKVTDMSFMFQKYGHESQTFNAVPDVSNWNTGKVENMQQMFYEYGHKSTALNTVPNVSGWNTSNVTNMSGMFNGYGNTSTNISCVLDLSGWDLSKITENNGVNVFNFNPQTFNVTIPAKTGEKSNEGENWYYGNGTNSIAPPTGKTFTILPAGALKGVFSVSATKKVYFSKGNLWYGKAGSATTATFNFEANQYDTTPESNDFWSPGHISHFFWSKTASVTYAQLYSDAGAAVGDVFFTNATTETAKSDFIVNGVTGQYRTLSKDEWVYLINKSGDENIRKGKYKNGVTVCEKTNCLILVPDECLNGYSFDSAKTNYTADEWATAEAAGLVCLPAAGSRSGSRVNGVGDSGYYGSSTAKDQEKAYCVYNMYGRSITPDSPGNRIWGYSVRLVTEGK